MCFQCGEIGIWHSLVDLSLNLDAPWIVLGYFNVVLGAHEKTGLAPSRVACANFWLAIDNANLLELDIIGVFFI